MKQKNTPPGDDVKIRCPRLGHQIHFAYCCMENNGLPCAKALDCWYDHFLVESFLRDALSIEDWNTAFNKPPAPKMLSLLALIDQAKQSNQRGGS